MVLRSRRPGMTLVETVIALAIGFAVLLMLWSSMSASAKRFRAGESGLEAVLEAQRIMEYLRQDVSGPYPWDPCNYPEDELRKVGVATSKVGFSILPRRVNHWIDYYREDVGPIQPKTRHVARVQRRSDPNAPCGVSWDPDLSRWIDQPPPKRVLQELLVSRTHPVEAVPGEQGGRKAVYVIGPAIWVHDHEQGMMLRYTEQNGWVEFGKGRVKEADLRATFQQSWNYVTDVPDPPAELVVTHKTLLAVQLRLRRDEGRPDLEILQVLAKR